MRYTLLCILIRHFTKSSGVQEKNKFPTRKENCFLLHPNNIGKGNGNQAPQRGRRGKNIEVLWHLEPTLNQFQVVPSRVQMYEKERTTKNFAKKQCLQSLPVWVWPLTEKKNIPATSHVTLFQLLAPSPQKEFLVPTRIRKSVACGHGVEVTRQRLRGLFHEFCHKNGARKNF